MYASIHLRDLEILVAISSHPTIRLAAREVVYVGVYFHYPVAVSRQRDLNDPDFYQDEDEMQPRDVLYNCTEFYNARLREQEETRKSAYDLTVISAALAGMPNVRTFILRNTSFRSVPSHRSHFSQAMRPIGISLRIEEGVHAYEPFDYGFQIMCKAASISGRQIEKFQVDYEGRDVFFHGLIGEDYGLLHVSFICPSGDLEHYCNTFRHLYTARLRIYNPGRQHHIFEAGNLPMILAAATDLEEMEVIVVNEMEKVTFAEVSSTHTWSHLRLLYLKGVEMTSEEVIGFVRRHSRTLKTLRLRNVLLKERWEGAALRLRRLRCPSLTTVICGRLYEVGRKSKVLGSEVSNCILGLEYGSFYTHAKSSYEHNGDNGIALDHNDLSVDPDNDW
ncbi:hypothetical protein GGR53DRAFT_531402 [Hypoxylon sp. FL1150]|nr:hypothetical protein GGR53DRAFT_531402 [Hypoxylon sp. FL1150]